jgi:S-formylglutathione hydrolase FrmB
MASFAINFYSKEMDHHVDVTVMIPDTAPVDNIPVLWLLHGMTGDHTGWIRNTCIERYSKKYGIAVVCPSAENSYYCDMVYGKKFYSFVTRELVDYMRRIFRFSEKREDNYIAGLSMGGYGALRIALLNPEQYCATAPLSGVLDIVSSLSHCSWSGIARNIWGENFAETVKGSDNDIFHIAETFPEDKEKPYVFVACGYNDFLLGQNKDAVAKLYECGFHIDYMEGEGEHNWDFWDPWINVAIGEMFKNTGREVK